MGEMIQIDADLKIDAYLAKPDGEAKGAIIVIHEIWGLVDHIKSIADRYAKEGYIALAPNLLFEINFAGTDIGELQQELFDPERRSQAQPKIRALMTPMQNPNFGQLTVGRIKACFDYLINMPESGSKVAVTGFCFGGTYSFALAIAEPGLKLAMPFYGHAEQGASEIAKIKCPIRAFYGANDENLMSTLDDLKARMKEAGVDYEAKVYEGCGHAFFNDTNPYTYNEAAASDAWGRAQEALKKAFA